VLPVACFLGDVNDPRCCVICCWCRFQIHALPSLVTQTNYEAIWKELPLSVNRFAPLKLRTKSKKKKKKKRQTLKINTSYCWGYWVCCVFRASNKHRKMCDFFCKFTEYTDRFLRSLWCTTADIFSSVIIRFVVV
jgi:hypothetical protein